MPEAVFDDLQSFIEACRQINEVRDIEGADWNQEIGALTEATAELIAEPPLLLFDHIKGYPAGYRVANLTLGSYRRVALALGLPLELDKMELSRMAARKIRGAGSPIPPEYVATGPVVDHVMTGDDIDLFRFPVPQFHASDGGRYIGTGDCVINRDPESGYLNMGTYRMQLHEKDVLGLWMSPGQQGRQICRRYWDQGKSCPIVAAFGIDPLTFMAAHTKRTWGKSELDFVGGLRGRPLQVVKGEYTGLPIPAHAEIAIEGEVPPPSVEARAEGPFGEWPGYYSGGTLGTGELQPVIKVKAVYHRHRPILLNEAPLWPGAPKFGLPIGSGVLWDQLEHMGIQDIVSVYNHNRYFIVVSIKQRYPGHAKQTGVAVLGCAEASRNGRYIVVVDEDIDPSDMKEVLWAMMTRVNPSTDIDFVDGTLSTPIDPRMSPFKKESGDVTNSRAIFYAVKPFSWIERFPKSSRTERELRRQVVEKYSSLFPFKV